MYADPHASITSAEHDFGTLLLLLAEVKSDVDRFDAIHHIFRILLYVFLSMDSRAAVIVFADKEGRVIATVQDCFQLPDKPTAWRC